MSADESVLGGGRFATDGSGYSAMLHRVAVWPNRVWAVEGCNGIGRHIVHRLLADGEEVLDVRPKPFGTGSGVLDGAGPQDRRH